MTINEYVDLAKVYSTPKSGSYINGMLDAIARHLISTGKMLKTMDDSRQKREVNPSAEDVQEQQQDNAEVNATETEVEKEVEKETETENKEDQE